jgi:hypothetical protein
MKTICIYTLVDPITNQIRYVGKTQLKVNKRLNAHITTSKLGSKSHKANWIRSLLEKDKKPTIEVIDEVSSEDWEFWETYWITQLRCWGFNLTNLTSGGIGLNGYKHNKESKLKMRKSKLGCTLTNSHKEEISKSVKDIYIDRPNYNRSGNNIKKVIDKDLLYKLYITDNLSIPSISKELGFSGKKIWQSLQDHNIKKEKEVWKKQLSNSKKIVYQYSLDGNFLKEWDSPAQVNRELGYNKGNIANVCRGLSKTAMGFIWRYKDEFIKIDLDLIR